MQLRIPSITSRIAASDRWDHFLARWGVNRGGHRIEPGLYALGAPTPDSPVFVTANYTLSFDALRSALTGIDAYIMVLDTHGINVWCAAGKGTFGTDELVHRIEATQLHQVVRHRALILPQLGAPGVAAHEVKKRSGFKVEYGPVRAADLPDYLKTHQATPEMRRVSFGLRDRLVLIPVELVYVLIPLLVVGLLMRFPGAVVAILAGVVLFPILLPWIPTHDFSTKGLILGEAAQLPFVAAALLSQPAPAWWVQVGQMLVYLLALPAVTAYLALNFTGSTSFTSRTGVRREIFAYIPVMAWMAGIGGAALLVLYVRYILGA
jgi:CO dehydrogenase/acetyl-CoA synthase delta subunit